MRRPAIVLATLAIGIVPLLLAAPAEAASYSVSAAMSKTWIVSGDGVKIAGKIKPGTVGKTVYIQQYTGGTWVTRDTATTTTGGAYSKTIDPVVPGVKKYRVKATSQGSYSSGASKTVKVSVYGWFELAELKTVKNRSDLYYDGGSGFTLVQDGVESGDDAWVNDDVAGGFGSGETIWDLQGLCRQVRGRAGIDDTSDTGAIGRLRINFDGSGDFLGVYDGGDAEDVVVTINLTDKLTIKSSRGNPDESTIVGFGEPEVLCRGALPTD